MNTNNHTNDKHVIDRTIHAFGPVSELVQGVRFSNTHKLVKKN